MTDSAVCDAQTFYVVLLLLGLLSLWPVAQVLYPLLEPSQSLSLGDLALPSITLCPPLYPLPVPVSVTALLTLTPSGLQSSAGNYPIVLGYYRLGGHPLSTMGLM